MPGTQQMLIELPLTLALLSLGRMHGTETYLHGSFWKKKMRVGGSHTPTEQEKAQVLISRWYRERRQVEKIPHNLL